MKSIFKMFLVVSLIVGFSVISALTFGLPTAVAFTPLAGDLATYDPNNQTFPTSGDTIKIGVFTPFSGPNAYVGEGFWAVYGFAVHDVNSQGGILVDGKRKKIQLIKLDTMVKPAVGKRAAERFVLQEKGDMFIGTAGSHVNLVAQQTAKKYKTIYVTAHAYSDALLNAKNFTVYNFRTCGSATTTARAAAYYYAARSESKFYILAQDYLWGHSYANAFKAALKEFRPDAEIVGEDYFALFTKDFAPYLEKVRASGAEVIVTGAWGVDNQNTIKQSRQMGLKNPLIPSRFITIISPFAGDPRHLKAIGGPAGVGIVVANDYFLYRSRPGAAKLTEIWTDLWKNKWQDPYNGILYRWPGGGWLRDLTSLYWYLDVIQRAGSTKPEKVIAAWEGAKFKLFGYELYMRPDDHQAIFDHWVSEMEFPNTWDLPDNAAARYEAFVVPAKFVMPLFDEELRGRAGK
ncbi:MAG: ABC transporter substrate-binding protein [Candidatus Binatia bacterium]